VKSLVAIIAGAAFAPAGALAADEAAPVPVLHERTGDPGERLQRDGALGVTRRARVPGRGEGDVSLGLQSTRPGDLGAAPDGALEARVGIGWGLVAGAQVERTGGADTTWRPGASLLWQFVGRDGGPLSLAAGAVVRSEGFDEPEGEVEGLLAASLRAGRLELHLNAVGGGEPDGAEGDLEGAFAGGYRLTPDLLAGVEARGRAGYGDKVGGFGEQHDELGAAMAQLRVDRFLVTALAGVSSGVVSGATRTGAAALLRLGCGF
jgi:hypothetical protein